MPIQMFNWISRPEAAFHANAAAAGFVLMFMTLAMNGLAIWLRYRLRKQHQMVDGDREPMMSAPENRDDPSRSCSAHQGRVAQRL